MRTYIVIATESERQLINEFLTEWDITHAKVIVTGVGGLNVIAALKKLKKKSRIINIGYVGSNSYDVGTRIVVGCSSLYHPNVKYESPIYYPSYFDTKFYVEKGITCFTSNDFVTFTRIKTPVVFDMELAFICSLGFKEVVSFKKVSDKLNYKQYKAVVREKE